jgi:transcriptional regulator with XRE-family HTH domain
MDHLEALSQNIRSCIDAAGYRSVELFAHENNLEKSTLSRILSGKREPKIMTLLRIAQALGVTLDVLCYSHGIGPKITETDSRYKTPKTERGGYQGKPTTGKKKK